MLERPTLVRAPFAPGPGFLPLPAPTSLEATGLSLDLVTQLVLKTLYFAGEMSGAELARRLGVVFAVLEPSLEFLKSQHYCEIVGGSMLGGGSYEFRITSEGRTAALQFLQQSQYVGVAPVPIAHYRRYMKTIRQLMSATVTQTAVRDALGDLVLSDRVLDNIATALNGMHSIFIYGPPGNGKTRIASRQSDTPWLWEWPSSPWSAGRVWKRTACGSPHSKSPTASNFKCKCPPNWWPCTPSTPTSPTRRNPRAAPTPARSNSLPSPLTAA